MTEASKVVNKRIKSLLLTTLHVLPRATFVGGIANAQKCETRLSDAEALKKQQEGASRNRRFHTFVINKHSRLRAQIEHLDSASDSSKHCIAIAVEVKT